MKIALIAAVGNNRVIGHKNKLPWHLPADLQFFKRCTMNKPIIMGRSTYESIGRILPGRQNIVVTKNKNFKIEAVVPEKTSLTIVHSLAGALQAVDPDAREVMIIGGSTLFNEALPIADRLYMTIIHADFEGDTFFPEIDSAKWQEITRENHKADAKNAHDYSFMTFERKTEN